MSAHLETYGYVLCNSPDGWSLHRPGSTDDEIASGDAPYLACGAGQPTQSDYDRARLAQDADYGPSRDGRWLDYVRGAGGDTVLLTDDSRVLASWTVDPQVARDYLAPGDLDEWEPYPGEPRTLAIDELADELGREPEPADWGEVLDFTRASERARAIAARELS